MFEGRSNKSRDTNRPIGDVDPVHKCTGRIHRRILPSVPASVERCYGRCFFKLYCRFQRQSYCPYGAVMFLADARSYIIFAF